MSHQNFILPTSGVGHVVSLLLSRYKVPGGEGVIVTIKRVVCYMTGYDYKKILPSRDSNLVHYLSQPARKQLMLMNSFFSQYLVSLSRST